VIWLLLDYLLGIALVLFFLYRCRLQYNFS
jgi:hypothetical protein